MTQMQCVVARGAKRLALETRPQPEPGPGEARVRIRACGICGTDIHFHHIGAFADGHTPGHEMFGDVDALGEGASGVAIGDPVAIEPLSPCGECSACNSGRQNICPGLSVYGIHRPGGLCESICMPTGSLFAVPASLPSEIAAMAEPMAVSWHGVARSGLVAGERVLILGAGTIGLLSVLAAKAQGADEIWISARHKHQAELAQALGATRILDESEAEPSVLAGMTSEAPVDRVIETVGGTADTVRNAVTAMRPGGTVSVVGVFMGDVAVPAIPMLLKEGNLVWSNCYQRAGERPDFAEAIALLDRERSRVSALATHQVPLSEIERGFALAGDRAAGSVKVTIIPD